MLFATPCAREESEPMIAVCHVLKKRVAHLPVVIAAPQVVERIDEPTLGCLLEQLESCENE
jgi:hypothetical protein